MRLASLLAILAVTLTAAAAAASAPKASGSPATGTISGPNEPGPYHLGSTVSFTASVTGIKGGQSPGVYVECRSVVDSSLLYGRLGSPDSAFVLDGEPWTSQPDDADCVAHLRLVNGAGGKFTELDSASFFAEGDSGVAAVPTFVGAGTGVADASGTFSATKTGVTVGNYIIVQLWQDGIGSEAHLAMDTFTGVQSLGGTASSMTRIAAKSVTGVGWQSLFAGRATATTVTVGSSTGVADDVFLRVYEFSGVAPLGQASYENNGDGATESSEGATTTVNQTTVQTGGPQRLALNFVALSDDNATVAFAGASGGTWAEAVAEFASATGTDATLQLQTATMASAGTISSGSFTQASAVGWASTGLALIPPFFSDAPTAHVRKIQHLLVR